jgi:hypothetical protein
VKVKASEMGGESYVHLRACAGTGVEGAVGRDTRIAGSAARPPPAPSRGTRVESLYGWAPPREG